MAPLTPIGVSLVFPSHSPRSAGRRGSSEYWSNGSQIECFAEGADNGPPYASLCGVASGAATAILVMSEVRPECRHEAVELWAPPRTLRDIKKRRESAW